MKSILFVTRGRGWGHARRDMLIIDSLNEKKESFNINLISEGAGYQAYRAYGYSCTQVETLAEEWRWLAKVNELLQEWGIPDLVVSDEHFGGLIVAQELQVPSVFITDWFPVGQFDCPEFVSDFDKADAIIYPGYQSSAPIPEQLTGKVHLVGPIVKSNPHLQRPRSQLKSELRLRPDAPLILLTGGGEPEDENYFRTCIHASERLSDEVQLVVIAGKLRETLAKVYSAMVKILNYTMQMDKYMAASEVVITRPGHSTLWELAVYAIPSITIVPPPKLNPMPGIHAMAMERWGYTHVISADQLSVEKVAEFLLKILASQELERKRIKSLHKPARASGAQAAKEVILSYLL